VESTVLTNLAGRLPHRVEEPDRSRPPSRTPYAVGTAFTAAWQRASTLSLAQQVSSDVRAQMLRRDDDPGLGARLIAWGARNVAGTAAPAAWSRRIRGVWEVQRPGPPKCARASAVRTPTGAAGRERVHCRLNKSLVTNSRKSAKTLRGCDVWVLICRGRKLMRSHARTLLAMHVPR
jgi:hypothetical protein